MREHWQDMHAAPDPAQPRHVPLRMATNGLESTKAQGKSIGGDMVHVWVFGGGGGG